MENTKPPEITRRELVRGAVSLAAVGFSYAEAGAAPHPPEGKLDPALEATLRKAYEASRESMKVKEELLSYLSELLSKIIDIAKENYQIDTEISVPEDAAYKLDENTGTLHYYLLFDEERIEGTVTVREDGILYVEDFAHSVMKLLFSKEIIDK